MGFHPAYTGYYFDVRIFNVRSSPKDEFHFQAPQYPFVTGVTVSFELTWDVSTISFSIDAPFEEGLRMLNSNIFTAYNQVEVRIGYPNGPKSPPFYGFLQNGGVGLELTPNGLTGTITCTSGTSADQYERRHNSPSLEKAFRDAVITSGRYKDVKFEDGSQKAFDDFSNYRVTGSMPNLEVMEMAHRMTNTYSLQSETNPDILKVWYRPDQKSGKPFRRFVMRGQFSEGPPPTYPIMSFQPSIGAAQFAFSPAGASGMEAPRILDSGEIETIEAKPEDSNEQAGQDEVAIEAATDKKIEAGEGGPRRQADKVLDAATEAVRTVVFPGSGAAEWAEPLLKNLQVHMARTLGWSATLTTVGIPDVRGEEVLEVLGMGTLFNGVYTIDKVTHSCANGDFQTALTVHSGLSKTNAGANKGTA